MVHAYCLSCKEHNEILSPSEDRSKNGRPILRGTCSHCHKKVVKFQSGKSGSGISLHGTGQSGGLLPAAVIFPIAMKMTLPILMTTLAPVLKLSGALLASYLINRFKLFDLLPRGFNLAGTLAKISVEKHPGRLLALKLEASLQAVELLESLKNKFTGSKEKIATEKAEKAKDTIEEVVENIEELKDLSPDEVARKIIPDLAKLDDLMKELDDLYRNLENLEDIQEGSGLEPDPNGVFLSPTGRNNMVDYWDQEVAKITICTTPVDSVIYGLLNVSTGLQLSKRLKKLKIPNLIHPYIVFHFEGMSSPALRFEREQRIELIEYKPVKGDKCINTISVKETLGELIQPFLTSLGGTFDTIAKYRPDTENSQIFVKRFLEANDLNTSKLEAFYKQPTEKIMKTFKTTNDLVGKINHLGISVSHLKD